MLGVNVVTIADVHGTRSCNVERVDARQILDAICGKCGQYFTTNGVFRYELWDPYYPYSLYMCYRCGKKVVPPRVEVRLNGNVIA